MNGELAGTKVLKKKKNGFADKRNLGIWLFILISSIFIQLMNPKFLTSENIMDLLKNTSILGVLSIGMMMVILTGGIDLSAGAVIALSGMTAATLVSHYPDLPPLLVIVIGAGVGTACGLLLGLLVSKGKIIPIIASLGMMNVYRGLTYVIGNNGWISAYQMPASFKGIATGKLLGLNNLIWICGILFLIFYYVLNFTRIGRQIYAVGSNEEATLITGINKDRVLCTAYALNGLLAGLAGVLWVSKFASAQGDTASGYEMNIIAACVLGGVSITGGVGTISGLVTGTLLFGILNNALPLLNVSTFWEDAIQGCVILFAVVMNVMIKRNNDKNDLKRRKV